MDSWWVKGPEDFRYICTLGIRTALRDKELLKLVGHPLPSCCRMRAQFPNKAGGKGPLGITTVRSVGIQIFPHLLASLKEQPGASMLLCEIGREM